MKTMDIRKATELEQKYNDLTLKIKEGEAQEDKLEKVRITYSENYLKANRPAVKHTKFGKGTIINIEDNKVVIKIEDTQQIKTFSLSMVLNNGLLKILDEEYEKGLAFVEIEPINIDECKNMQNEIENWFMERGFFKSNMKANEARFLDENGFDIFGYYKNGELFDNNGYDQSGFNKYGISRDNKTRGGEPVMYYSEKNKGNVLTHSNHFISGETFYITEYIKLSERLFCDELKANLSQKMYEYKHSDELGFKEAYKIFTPMLRDAIVILIKQLGLNGEIVLTAVPTSNGREASVLQSLNDIKDEINEHLKQEGSNAKVTIENLIKRAKPIRSSCQNPGNRPTLSEQLESMSFVGKGDSERQTVIVVDDIVTTGTTISACKKVLTRGGIKTDRIQTLALMQAV